MSRPNRSLLVALAACAGLATTATSQDQIHPELGRFSTAPPVGSFAGGGVFNDAPNMLLGGGALNSRMDSTDIRVNQVTSSPQNETSFAVNPNNRDNWVGVANDYRNGSVEIGWYSTLDGGTTWTTNTFGIDSSFSFSGDPCVAFAADGTAVIVGMQYQGAGGSRVTSYRSLDGGLTWTKSFVDLDSSNDKPQVDADLSGTNPGSLTTAWDRFGTTGGDPIFASTSSDTGATWSTGQRISDSSSVNDISPDVAYGANGEVYVMWADRGSNKRVLFDRSFDNGATWGTDVLVANFGQVPSPIPGSVFRMFDIFAMDADQSSGPYSGNIYVAYHTWTGGQADVRVATSSDNGSTWSQNVLVNNDGANFDQVFPGVVVDPAGNVNVTFFDRRLDPSNYLLWTWLGRSSDGGQSWSNTRASDVGWNHASTEFSGTFIGDYIDVEASDRSIFPFWVDGRSGNTQDVYTDRMNMALSTDVETIPAGVGGSAQISVNIGPNYAGAKYLVVASASGTSPGVIVSGVDIPLNPDVVTDLSQLFANTAIFQNNVGVLDATGSATVGFDTLGPRPFLAGMTWDWVCVVLDAGNNVVHSTAPTSIGF
ncbi:MAG: hypothetical protein ACI8QS_000165 [Planctomycetota bacterium]|jgi:hypothetical protein